MQPIGHDSPARPGTLADSDVALYLGFVEELASADSAGIASRFLAADFVEHADGRDHSASETATRLVARRARFPGAEWTIDVLTSVGGLVVCHATMSFAGRSGTRARWSEIVIARIMAGRIAECWRVSDGDIDRGREFAIPE